MEFLKTLYEAACVYLNIIFSCGLIPGIIVLLIIGFFAFVAIGAFFEMFRPFKKEDMGGLPWNDTGLGGF